MKTEADYKRALADTIQPIGPDLKAAIVAVIDYNWARELASYCESRTEDPDDTEGHIFHALVKLDQYVYYHNRTADDFADEA
jgi:hypothetical protein